MTTGDEKQPRWLDSHLVEILHGESLALFGGAPGLRDQTLLQSALARPRNLFTYEGVHDPFRLAAAYAWGIARNHPFVDGNKRASLLAARAFLFLNGYRLEPDEEQTVNVIEGLAANSVDEAALARWLEDSSRSGMSRG